MGVEERDRPPLNVLSSLSRKTKGPSRAPKERLEPKSRQSDAHRASGQQKYKVVGVKERDWSPLNVLAHLPGKRRAHQECPRNESNPKPIKVMPAKWVTNKMARQHEWSPLNVLSSLVHQTDGPRSANKERRRNAHKERRQGVAKERPRKSSNPNPAKAMPSPLRDFAVFYFLPPRGKPQPSPRLSRFFFFLPAGNPDLPRDLAVFLFCFPAGNPSLPRDFAAFFPFLPAGNPNLPRDLAVFFPSSPRETPAFPVT